jgi:hypothetical protein
VVDWVRPSRVAPHVSAVLAAWLFVWFIGEVANRVRLLTPSWLAFQKPGAPTVEAYEAAIRERSRRWFTACLGALVLVACAWGIAVAVEATNRKFPGITLFGIRIPAIPLHDIEVLTVVVAVLLALTFTIVRRMWRSPELARTASRVGVQVAGYAFVLAFATVAVSTVRVASTGHVPMHGIAAVALAGFAFAFVLRKYVARGLGSLHDFYQDRIAEAFMPPASDSGGPPLFDLLLSEVDPSARAGARPGSSSSTVPAGRGADLRIPYPIINTTVNLPRPDPGEPHGTTDIFVLAPRFCGSDRTGYRPTDAFASGTISLAGAVAASGAAVTPQMGIYTQPMLSFLISLFNLRLGMLVPNPAHRRWRVGGAIGVPDEWLHFRMSQRSRHSYLSDGGHHENLGLVSLLRRRCRYVVVIDAEADPERALGGLARAIQLARVDHGIEVDLDTRELELGRDGRSHSSFAVGTITYPPDRSSKGSRGADVREAGIMVYVKATLTGDEPPDLRNFHMRHPSFPHRSTLYQFFSDEEFEAYRALGHHCASAALDVAPLKAASGLPLDAPIDPVFEELWARERIRRQDVAATSSAWRARNAQRRARRSALARVLEGWALRHREEAISLLARLTATSARGANGARNGANVVHAHAGSPDA